MSTTTNTVKFNVGGKHSEVSRDLLEEHSETFLGKLVSEAWQADPEERIFIDRDGDIFAHVLNYLRYGSIELPQNVTRSSFERDLDFYGLAAIEGDIKCSSMADVISSLESGKQKHDAFLLAVEVFQFYMKTAETVVYSVDVKTLYRNITKEQSVSLPGKVKTYFLHYLDVYFGLKCTETSNSYNYSNVSVSKK